VHERQVFLEPVNDLFPFHCHRLSSLDSPAVRLEGDGRDDGVGNAVGAA
jgi:hypothetical protein